MLVKDKTTLTCTRHHTLQRRSGGWYRC